MATKKQRRLIRIGAVLLLIGAFIAYIVCHPDSWKLFAGLEEFDPIWGSSKTEQLPELKSEQTSADSLLAKDVLENLAVKEKYTGKKYYRKLFYDNWSQTSSGCNMREAVLTRDLKDIVFDGCKVKTGTLEDPYTGKTINFVRGQATSSAVQIDHVVALSNAWVTGAYDFDKDKRYEISQDPLNLVAVDGPANQQKSDQDASDWLPSNDGYKCGYVARQISVKYKYQLWVTPAEKQAMQNVLLACPDEPTLGLE